MGSGCIFKVDNYMMHYDVRCVIDALSFRLVVCYAGYANRAWLVVYPR